jgi:hypothetical protein
MIIGVIDEPVWRCPICKLPIPPSPRKSMDSKIVKLFLKTRKFLFEVYFLIYFNIPNNKIHFVFIRWCWSIGYSKGYIFIGLKIKIINTIYWIYSWWCLKENKYEYSLMRESFEMIQIDPGSDGLWIKLRWIITWLSLYPRQDCRMFYSPSRIFRATSRFG